MPTNVLPLTMQVSNTWDGNLSGTSTKKWCKSMVGTARPDPEHAVAEVVEPLLCPIRNTSRCSRVEAMAIGTAIDTEDGEMTDGEPPMPEMAVVAGSEEATLTAVAAAVTVAIAVEAMTIGVVALDTAIVIVVDTAEVGVMEADEDED